MNDVETSLPKDYVPSFSRKLLFFVTYGVVILAATSPLASYAAMHNDIPNFTSSSSFLVYGIATIGTGCGKLLPGYVVARFGARAIYLYLIFTIGILCMLLSFSQTVMHVAIFEFFIELHAGTAWPAHAVMIRGNFGENLIGEGIQIISLSSRGSDLFGKGLYGTMLYKHISWRYILRLASILCFACALLSRLHQDSVKTPDIYNPNITINDIRKRTITILCRKRFWSGALVMLFLTLLKRSGQLMPVYFNDTSTIVNEGSASWYAAIFQVGLLSSIFIGGSIYNRIVDGKNKRLLCVALLIFGVILSSLLAIFGVQKSNSYNMLMFRCVLIFFYACSIGLTYFIPTAVFSIKFGQKDTATVSALMDFVGYTFGSAFLINILTPMQKYLGWRYVWAFYSLLTLLSVFITYDFMTMLEVDDTINWSNLRYKYISQRCIKSNENDDIGGKDKKILIDYVDKTTNDMEEEEEEDDDNEEKPLLGGIK